MIDDYHKKNIYKFNSNLGMKSMEGERPFVKILVICMD